MATVIALIFAILVVRTYQATCCWQSGDVADGQVACQGGSGSCCDSNDACFSNGVCLGSEGYLYQGACTIRGWAQGTDGCFSECDTNKSGVTFAPVSPCQGKLCCGWAYDAADCCADDNDGFTFDSGAFAGHFDSSLFVNIRRSVQSSAVARAATATTTVTSTARATNAAQLAGSGYVKNSVPIGIGVALGVALLVALGIIAWLLIRLKRSESVPAGTAHQAPQYHPVEAGSYPKPYEVQYTPRFEVQGNDVPELYPGARPGESGYPRP